MVSFNHNHDYDHVSIYQHHHNHDDVSIYIYEATITIAIIWVSVENPWQSQSWSREYLPTPSQSWWWWSGGEPIAEQGLPTETPNHRQVVFNLLAYQSITRSVLKFWEFKPLSGPFLWNYVFDNILYIHKTVSPQAANISLGCFREATVATPPTLSATWACRQRW